jgi:histone-lysine N-methyltransferase SETMAR
MSPGYYRKIFRKDIGSAGGGTTKTGSSNDQDRDINVHCFFNPNGFGIMDLLPEWNNFSPQYLIHQILEPLSEEHSSKSADIARRSLGLHFDNSGRPTANIGSEEMTRLKCKMMPHPSYSLDLAITDFHLFSVLKQKLQGTDVSEEEELKSDILTIFQGIASDEVKSHLVTESKDASELP